MVSAVERCPPAMIDWWSSGSSMGAAVESPGRAASVIVRPLGRFVPLGRCGAPVSVIRRNPAQQQQVAGIGNVGSRIVRAPGISGIENCPGNHGAPAVSIPKAKYRAYGTTRNKDVSE